MKNGRFTSAPRTEPAAAARNRSWSAPAASRCCQHFFLQPMDGPDREANTALAVRYCLEQARWRLNLQMHMLMDIP
jgi:hypothetical protein